MLRMANHGVGGKPRHARVCGYTLSRMTLGKRALLALLLTFGVCVASSGCTPITVPCVGSGGLPC